MVRPHSLDAQTVEQLREVVVASYAGRDDLYAAAEKLNDDDLSVVCRKLAEELADHSATLQQIIVMQGAEAAEPNRIRSALSSELAKYLRANAPEKTILKGAEISQKEVRGKYDDAIASAPDSDAQALLRKQRDDVDFGERVLRRLSEGASPDPQD